MTTDSRRRDIQGADNFVSDALMRPCPASRSHAIYASLRMLGEIPRLLARLTRG